MQKLISYYIIDNFLSIVIIAVLLIIFFAAIISLWAVSEGQARVLLGGSHGSLKQISIRIMIWQMLVWLVFIAMDHQVINTQKYHHTIS